MAKEVKKIVNRVLDRKLEDKHIIWQLDNLTVHNSAISSADVVPIVQQIAQGSGSEQRIADRISPKYLRVSGVVSLKDSNSTTLDYHPITVRVMAFRQNDVVVGSSSTSVDTSNLIRDTAGGTGSRQFTGLTSDLMLPINDDKFIKIFDRQFTLAPQFASGVVTVPMPNYQRKYSFRVKLPKQLKYDAGTGNWANNFAPFMAVGYAYADGTAPDSVTTRIRNTAVAHLQFEDA